MPVPDPRELLDTVREELSLWFKDAPRSPDERLVARARVKEQRWVRHRRAFFVVGLGLISLNFVIALATGLRFPWAAFPIIGWGMGFVIHSLSYRAWVRENARALHVAKARLGLTEPEGPPAKARLAAPEVVQVEGVVLQDAAWRGLVVRGRQAVERVKAQVSGRVPAAIDTKELDASLRDGLDRLERLALGAERLRSAVAELAPEGLSGLTREIDRLDGLLVSRTGEDLREAYLQNRCLLVARRAKIESLVTESERMRVVGEGFLLAAENVRLDVARLDADGDGAARSMAAPLERLGREVAVLESVEAELRRL